VAERLVFISGGAYTAEMRVFVESVANRVLEKPVRPEVLLAVVEASVRAREPEPQVPVAAAGGVR
jgi:DNA-binding response OmpR family regulator